MTSTKKATPNKVECVALRNLCCDDQVKAGKSFTCTQEQFKHFESAGAAVKKVEAV
jgi:hypothetical protein